VGELVEIQADLEGRRTFEGAAGDARGSVEASRFAEFVGVHDRSAVLFPDAPMMRGTIGGTEVGAGGGPGSAAVRRAGLARLLVR